MNDAINESWFIRQYQMTYSHFHTKYYLSCTRNQKPSNLRQTSEDFTSSGFPQQPLFASIFCHPGRAKLWLFVFFFLIKSDTDDSQDSRGREGTIFYFTLPLPPAHEHSDIYLQLCMWDDYRIFLIAPLVFTRLLLDEIYHLIELPFDWLMLHLFVCI